VLVRAALPSPERDTEADHAGERFGAPRYGLFDLALGVSVGASYVLMSWVEPYVMALLWSQEALTLARMERDGLGVLSRFGAPYLVPTLILSLGLLAPRASVFRASLLQADRHAVVLALIAGALGGFVLDALRLWPWVWRYSVESSSAMALALRSGGQWGAILFWLFGWGLLSPLLEEVIFRGSILQAAMRWLPAQGAIALSAVAFGLLHIGMTLDPSGAAIRNALFAVLFGIIAASVTLRRGGRLDAAIALHVGHATAGLVSLLVAA
jgi:membrane protease YdiL (CAAX protease family)